MFQPLQDCSMTIVGPCHVIEGHIKFILRSSGFTTFMAYMLQVITLFREFSLNTESNNYWK